jgi:DNA polymerase/3'-5' exonuclease PolX
MRRPLLAGDPLAGNKRIAEMLFLRAYDLLLEEAQGYRQWAYRKAAWAIDEMDTDVHAIYQQQGRKALENVTGVGKKLAREIEGWLQSRAEFSATEARR